MTEPVNNEAEQVSNEEANVEIVTKEPPIAIKPVPLKIKDPKKIEAGKKLAAYNKKAKKSKAELKDNSEISESSRETEPVGSGFNITLTTVVAIIGLGLTGVDLYLRHKKNNQKGMENYKMTTMDFKPVTNDKNEKTLVCNGVENEKNNKKGVKTIGFEPGME